VVEYLPSKTKVLGSNSRTTTTTKTKKSLKEKEVMG
jgi:hypothetical protein